MELEARVYLWRFVEFRAQLQASTPYNSRSYPAPHIHPGLNCIRALILELARAAAADRESKNAPTADPTLSLAAGRFPHNPTPEYTQEVQIVA
jgi:hypothetical protein